MAMPALRYRWTTAQVLALIAESERGWPRYELLGGELLVTPAPATIHQVAVNAIQFLLHTYMLQEQVGVVLSSPADLQLQPESIVQPDVFVVHSDKAVESEERVNWDDIASLLLAVEVISPTSVRTDRVEKRDYYMASDVEEYWVVDLDARLIERWRRNEETPKAVRDRFEWLPDGAREPLRIDVAALFKEIWDTYKSIQPRRI